MVHKDITIQNISLEHKIQSVLMEMAPLEENPIVIKYKTLQCELCYLEEQLETEDVFVSEPLSTDPGPCIL